MFNFLLIIWLIGVILNTLIFTISGRYGAKVEFRWLFARNIQNTVYRAFFDTFPDFSDFFMGFMVVGFFSVFWPIIGLFAAINSGVRAIFRAVYLRFDMEMDSILLRIFNRKH